MDEAAARDNYLHARNDSKTMNLYMYKLIY